MVCLNFRFLSSFKSGILSLFFSFSCLAVAIDNKQKIKVTAPVTITTESNKEDKEKAQKARGLVIRYYKWPNLKQQKEIARILKSSGLKKTKSIKPFKAQLFGWTKGGLKASKLGEKTCVKLKNLSYVRRCRPDHLLPLNQSKRNNLTKSRLSKTKKVNETNKREIQNKLTAPKKTEANFIFECKDCKKEDVKALSSVSQKTLNLRTCNIISHKRDLANGFLSDYWAQELIGSDLMREELKKTAPPEREDWIAIFDSKRENHNIAVKNLISGEGPHAVLPELEKRKVPFLETLNPKQLQSTVSLYETSYPGDYLFGFKKRPPHYINNSLLWLNSEDIYDGFKKLSSSVSQSIIVTASGNDFPKELVEDIKNKASKDFDMIVVGSFSPLGFVSEFSQSSREVFILAPSDDWITSAGKKWDKEQFGGTSGATPLVTGSLAGFEWLSGYHPTAKEAKVLLEKTALPTPHSFEKPRINGAGLLNAYKLGKVAQKLKEKCRSKLIQKKRNCFKKEILKEENYRFAKDKSLGKDLRRVFPSCSGGEPSEPSVSSCKEKKELFNRLRKELLLNPTREYYKNLSCLYKTADFLGNTMALNSLSLALGTESELRADIKAMLNKRKSIPKNILRLAVAMGGFEESFNNNELTEGVKIANGIGEKALPLLMRGFETGNPKLQKLALHSAGNTGEKALPLLTRGFETGNPDLQETALFSAIKMGEAGLPLLEQAFETGNPDLGETALFSVIKMGEAGLPLLEQAFKTGNPELQKTALDSASWMGEAGLPLLEQAFETGNPELQQKALDLASWIGKAGLPLLKRAFETKNLELQKTALFSTSWIGKAGLPLLKRAFETKNLELQKLALHSASQIGEAGLPVLEQAFETGNPELQKQALYVVRHIRQAGLPLLEQAFETGNPELQEAALHSANAIERKTAKPFLEKILKNQNLDEDIKRRINRALTHFKN